MEVRIGPDDITQFMVQRDHMLATRKVVLTEELCVCVCMEGGTPS